MVLPGVYQYLQSVQLILNTLKHLKVSHSKYKLQMKGIYGHDRDEVIVRGWRMC